MERNGENSTPVIPERKECGLPIGFSVPDWKPAASPSRRSFLGRYCRLDPLDVRLHSHALLAAFSVEPNGLIWTYLPYGPFTNRHEFEGWLTRDCLGDDPMFFTVFAEGSDLPCGLISFMRIAPSAGSMEVGHVIFSPALRQSRAATEVQYLMMMHAFELGYRRYEWKCDALNAASRRAAGRLGFLYEGLFRQAIVYKGRNRDTAWFSIIDRDWPSLKTAFERWLDPSNFDAAGRQVLKLSSLTAPIAKSAKEIYSQALTVIHEAAPSPSSGCP
jgi:RimJ/RimL family protein N-acetyltransferase